MLSPISTPQPLREVPQLPLAAGGGSASGAPQSLSSATTHVDHRHTVLQGRGVPWPET